MRLCSVAALLLASAMTLSACGPNAGRNPAARRALGPAAALNAAGEPQWSVQLRDGRMRVNVGDAAAIVVDVTREDLGAKGVVWRGAAPPAGGRPGAQFSLTALRKPCQDASTGLSYPLTATAALAGVRYAGCAAPPGQGLGPRR